MTLRVGPAVRRMFGPFEQHISDLYRSMYLNVDAFVELIHQWKATADNLLEVGCGEGAVTQRLRVRYPRSEITAIDITPQVGRLYSGPRERVTFLQCTVQEVAAKSPGRYDLAVLSDVLHHVPIESRQGILEAIRVALRPGGVLVFKDWQRNFSPIHWMCYASDRWLTGDRISYMTRLEMRQGLSLSFGAESLVAEARVRPWWNNLATLVRR